MNKFAKDNGYFVSWLLDKTTQGIYVTVGKGFAKEGNDVGYEVKYENEFMSLFKIVDGVKKLAKKSDYSSRVRKSGETVNEILKELSDTLLEQLCLEYDINEKYVYYEER